MLWISIKLFFAKYKLIKYFIFVAVICAILIFGIKLFYCIYTDSSQTTKGVVGTLFGALVGGILTLYGSLIINKKTQRTQNAVKRKNFIYKPLYEELMIIHNEILRENPFPKYIAFEKEPQTIMNHPQYTVWGRIKMDARFFEVPNKLKSAMEDLYKKINKYQKNRHLAVIVIDTIYREEIKKITNKTIHEQANIGEMLLSEVVNCNRPKDNILTWFDNTYSAEEKDLLWNNLCKRANENEELKNLKEVHEEWNKSEEFVIQLLSTYIEYIIKRFEE